MSVNDSYPLAPIWFTDVVGSALMILFSFLSVWYAMRLVKTQPAHVLWTYLLWLSAALAGFAVSRGVGHIAKRVLLILGMPDVWLTLRPFSGRYQHPGFRCSGVDNAVPSASAQDQQCDLEGQTGS